MRRLLAIITVIPLLFSACVKDPASSGKEIVTGDATDVTEASAILTGYAYTTPEMGEVTIGFVYSTDDAPSSENGEEVVSHELDEKNAFAVSISKLQPKTKYYYKAFLKYGGIYHYGKVKSFSTLEASKETGNYEAVDLGLSVKWATFNVGATKPEEYGDYFAWGETEPYYTEGHSQDNPCDSWREGKTGYDWPSYKYCNGDSHSLTRYCSISETGYWGGSGNPDDKTSFADYNYVDDAARANWHGSWRTPSFEEWMELWNNCTWEWKTNYNGSGVNGQLVTSKKPGYTDKAIFLPASGDRIRSDLRNVGVDGAYWSSSLYKGSSNMAKDICFRSGGILAECEYSRDNGEVIRPVKD